MVSAEKLQQINKQLSQKDQIIENMQEQLKKVQENLVRLEVQNQQYVTKIQDLENQISQELKIKDSLQQQLSLQQEEKTEVEYHQQESVEDIQLQSKELIIQKYLELQKLLFDLNQQLDEEKIKGLEKEIELESAIKNLNEHVEQLQIENGALKDKNLAQYEDYMRIKNQVQQQQLQINSSLYASQENKELEQKMSEQENLVKQLKQELAEISELKQVGDELITQLEEQLSESDNEKNKLSHVCQSLEAKLLQQEGQIQVLKDQVAQAQGENNLLQNQLDESDQIMKLNNIKEYKELLQYDYLKVLKQSAQQLGERMRLEVVSKCLPKQIENQIISLSIEKIANLKAAIRDCVQLFVVIMQQILCMDSEDSLQTQMQVARLITTCVQHLTQFDDKLQKAASQEQFDNLINSGFYEQSVQLQKIIVNITCWEEISEAIDSLKRWVSEQNIEQYKFEPYVLQAAIVIGQILISQFTMHKKQNQECKDSLKELIRLIDAGTYFVKIDLENIGEYFQSSEITQEELIQINTYGNQIYEQWLEKIRRYPTENFIVLMDKYQIWKQKYVDVQNIIIQIANLEDRAGKAVSDLTQKQLDIDQLQEKLQNVSSDNKELQKQISKHFICVCIANYIIPNYLTNNETVQSQSKKGFQYCKRRILIQLKQISN